MPNFSNFKDGFSVNFGIYEAGKILGIAQLWSPHLFPFMQDTGLIKNMQETWGEISYYLLPTAWGKGIATEVASSLQDYAFQKLHVDGVQGQVLETNTASQRVLEKIGMQRLANFQNLDSPQAKRIVLFGINRQMYGRLQEAKSKPKQ